MHTFVALLGNHRTISIAELSGLLPDFSPIATDYPQLLMFQTKEEIDQKFLDNLGGTILIARGVMSQGAELKDIPAILKTELAGVKGKAVFGFRFFGIPPRQAQNLYSDCKKALKFAGMSSRYVGSEREAAKAIQLHDEGMLEPKSGCELVLVRSAHGLWIGRTVAAQNIKEYTKRDMEKPVRDTSVGLLPPKLAQVMLNFGAFMTSQSPKAKTQKLVVFDPFCGTGVVPMEAMLRGWDVLASDLSEKAVKGTTANVEWVRKTFKVLKKDTDTTIWKQDAKKPFELEEKPSVIVTEGTLGPAMKSRPTIKEAEKYARDAGELAEAFLKNSAATLPGVPVVMMLPVWYAQKRLIWVEKIFDALPALGFTAVLPPHVDPSNPGRFSLLYRRPDQFVGREIVMLKPKK